MSSKDLTNAEVSKLLRPEQLISALETAFRERFPRLVLPARVHMATDQGVFLIMPCYDPVQKVLGMKFVVVQDDPERAEERVRARYVLLDPASGAITFSAEAGSLTALRTAATSALATKFLAREDARVLGLFGTGRQARVHAAVVPIARRFERILVCGRESNAARAFAAAIKDEVSLPVEAVDRDLCVQAADVICTCTNSSAPVFDGRLLRPGTHVNAVGAFQPNARELDSYTISSARVVVETYEGAMAEAGDLLIPLRAGEIDRDHIVADLHELVSGEKPTRVNPEEITVFKSVGCALEDLVAAELVQQNQAERAQSSTSA